MSAIFTGGYIDIPLWTADGEFSISGTATYVDGTSIVIGYTASGTNFLATRPSGDIRANVSGLVLNIAGTLSVGDAFNYTLSRDASNLVTLNVDGQIATGTKVGAFTLDAFGRFNNTANNYSGTISGSVPMSGSGSDRDYDFDNSTGTTLTDNGVSGSDGTIIGAVEFSAPPSNAIPTVTMPANQTGVAAGALVTLVAADADSDGTVVSRQWSEISSTGVALTGATTDTLSFNAPSTVSDQTLTFQYVVTDDGGATSNPAQATVGVLAAEVDSPSITIVQPTAANSARSWDANQNATFPVQLNINNLPAGAIVEVSQDGGSTYAALNATSTSSVSENLVVNGQKNVIFRLDTDPTITASIQLTAGFAILAWGQSNEKGQGNVGVNDGITYAGPTPLMFKNGQFETLVDNTVYDDILSATSTWPRIAQLYSAAGIPLILCNVAVGGTSVNAWLKATGIHYPRITEGVAAMNGANICTHLIGETDARTSRTLTELITKFGQMTDDVFADFGCQTYITEFPYKNDSGGSQKVIDAFADVILNNPNAFDGGKLQQIDIAQPATTDGLHLQTFEQLSLAAEIRYAAFNAVNSAVTIAGIPDGTHSLFLVNPLNGFIAYNAQAVFVGGSASVALSAYVGVTLKGYVDDGSTTNPIGGRVLKVV